LVFGPKNRGLIGRINQRERKTLISWRKTMYDLGAATPHARSMRRAAPGVVSRTRGAAGASEVRSTWAESLE